VAASAFWDHNQTKIGLVILSERSESKDPRLFLPLPLQLFFWLSFRAHLSFCLSFRSAAEKSAFALALSYCLSFRSAAEESAFALALSYCLSFRSAAEESAFDFAGLCERSPLNAV